MMLLCMVFLPMAAALCCYPLCRRSEKAGLRLTLGVTGLVFVMALSLLFLPALSGGLDAFCGNGIFFKAGGLRTVMAILAAFMWLMTALASPEYFDGARANARYFMFYLWTLGALLGVFLAADLMTLFVFFEIMSFTSYVWVTQNETPQAIRAGETYLFIAVIGGLTMLMGLFLLDNAIGKAILAEAGEDLPFFGSNLSFETILQYAPALSARLRYTVGVCALIGFGAKAGMFPLHIWLPKAHPVAPAPASALLSGILTKSGVFGIIGISCWLFDGLSGWGNLLLVPAVITMFLGALLAVFSVDLKRTLACSSMSQIGFIMTGISMCVLLGEHGAIAAYGTVLHVLNHSLIKLTLFVAAGVVYFNVHSLDLNDVRGFGRDKPFLKLAFLSGACSIAGIPGFSGYISKTLLHEGIVEYAEHLTEHGLSAAPYRAAEWIFLLSGGLTLAYMTRLFYILFVAPKPEHQHQKHGRYMGAGTAAVLAVGGAAMPLLGLTPHRTMDRIAAFALPFFRCHPMEHAVHYFSLTNLKGAAISITIGVLVFLVVGMKLLTVRENGAERYKNIWPQKLDLEDLIYRPFLKLLAAVGALFARLIELPGKWIVNGKGGKWIVALGTGLAKLIELPGAFLINGRGLGLLLDLGTGLARAVETVGTAIVLAPINLIFFRAKRVIEPPEDEQFSRYTRESERSRVDRSFSSDLLCAALGVLALLALAAWNMLR